MRFAQLDDAPRVLDCGIDLQPVADDAFVVQQPLALFRREARHAIDIEAAERRAEVLLLLQNRQPRQPCLIDLQHEALEQTIIAGNREAVLLIVIRPMQRMPARDVAVAVHPTILSSTVVENDWSSTSR